MATVTLYVGADNETGQIDLQRIADLVSKRHEGFTVLNAAGYWRGNAEPSAMIMISDSAESIAETAATLKSELNQEAIGMQAMPELTFV